MKLPMKMKDFLELAKNNNMVVDETVKGFMETFIDIVNTAYYQGISEGLKNGGNSNE